METLHVDSVYHWILGKKSDSKELTIEDIQDSIKHFDVMIREVDGNVVMFLDDKGRKFRQR